MGTRTITLHAFCSAKGGVGKSTLAVACAKLLASNGCVLIDADLTGTSLADGLRLCAPKVALRPNGTLDLDAPRAGAFYTHSETRALRAQRDASSRTNPDVKPLPPVYFNDALLYSNDDPSRECQIDALFWKHEQNDGVRYLPSSSLRNDVSVSLGWLYDSEYEQSWQRRTAWLLDEMSKRMPDLSHIVIDLPPGLLGFAHAILSLLADVSQRTLSLPGCPDWSTGNIRWQVKPSLVMSQDANDLLAALEYYTVVYFDLPELTPMVNRRTLGPEKIKQCVNELFPDQSVTGDLKNKLEFVGDYRTTLGQIFLPDVNDIHLDALDVKDLQALRKALRLEAAE